MMYVKVHTSGERYHNRIVIAVCDESLLGKTLTEKEISFTVSEHFYQGEKKQENEVIRILMDAQNCNLIGEEAVNAGIKSGIIHKETVVYIQGVPHAQAVSPAT